MAATVSTAPIGFLSHDGTSQIRGLIWAPERPAGTRAPAPRGVVQIVHGMSEHLGRYDEFARFLVGCGFVVCASDHVGHGKSVPDPAKLGCLPAHGGKDVLCLLYTSGGANPTFEQGATVYDALMACGLSVNASSTPLGIYVNAIGGLAEKEYPGESGWKYSVNGEVIMRSCDSVVLQDGDVVRWFYAR